MALSTFSCTRVITTTSTAGITKRTNSPALSRISRSHSFWTTAISDSISYIPQRVAGQIQEQFAQIAASRTTGQQLIDRALGQDASLVHDGHP